MDSNNKPFWEEFIDLYRQNSCLWDVKAKDYTNKVKRNESYNVLLYKLKESIPGASLETLKKKINNIRTSFRRELKKVQDSKALGMGGSNVYEPMLWYYNLLYFIAQSEQERKEKSDDDDDDDDDYVNDHVETNDMNFLDIQVKKEGSIIEPNSPEDIPDLKLDTEEEYSQPMYGASGPLFPNTMFSRKRRNNGNKLNSFRPKKFSLFNPAQRISDDDEFAVTGKKFAFQLKRMDDRQRLIAEKLISDVMFYGGMGKLSEDAVIQFSCGAAEANFLHDSSSKTHIL